MIKYVKKTTVIAAVVALAFVGVLLTVILVTCLGGKKLDFNAVFYYVCYDSPPDDSSMTSISGLVHSYGGAGYIVCCEGKNYVTVSCYYAEDDANSVCSQLKKMGLNCLVVKARTKDKKLTGRATKYAEQYKGNLNTLFSISQTCYNLANAVDSFSVGQNGAKSVLGEIKSSLKGLAGLNADNCFTEELNYLIAECEDISYGHVFSYDIRRLQIAVCDCIVNVNIY